MDGYPERAKEADGTPGRVTVAGGGNISEEQEKQVLSTRSDQCQSAKEFTEEMEKYQSATPK